MLDDRTADVEVVGQVVDLLRGDMVSDQGAKSRGRRQEFSREGPRSALIPGVGSRNEPQRRGSVRGWEKIKCPREAKPPRCFARAFLCNQARVTYSGLPTYRTRAAIASKFGGHDGHTATTRCLGLLCQCLRLPIPRTRSHTWDNLGPLDDAPNASYGFSSSSCGGRSEWRNSRPYLRTSSKPSTSLIDQATLDNQSWECGSLASRRWISATACSTAASRRSYFSLLAMVEAPTATDFSYDRLYGS